jgi:hypothetical protein
LKIAQRKCPSFSAFSYQMSNKPKTSAELMAELQSDPEFRAREAEADRKRIVREQEHQRLMRPLLLRLEQIGVSGTTLQEIVRRFAPLSPDAIQILLSALPEIDAPRPKESIVRALGAASEPFDGRPLIECYEQTRDEGVKWAVLNTIALARPHSIETWLATIRHTPAGDTLRKLSVSE